MVDDVSASNQGPPFLPGIGGKFARGRTSIQKIYSTFDLQRVRIVVLALIIFVLDTVIDLDIIVPILYVNVILLAMRTGRAGDTLIAGCGAICLTVISFLLTFHSELHLATALVNNALSLSAVVCVMVLGIKNVRSQNEIIRARDRVALVSRGAFLRTVSTSIVHEVTQPLAAIGASAEAAHRWLNREPPNLEETKTAARRIVHEVERASSVIGRLRRSITSGEIFPEVCDVRILLDGAVEHLRLELDEAAIEVTLRCPLGLMVTADRVLLEQVIINALSNAMDSLRAVDGTKRSILIEASTKGQGVKIAVTDNGAGVDEANFDRIFDPFFTTKLESGMGIGLAVSRSIIDAHNGSVRAFSNSPRGLVIEFEIPPLQAPDIR